MELAVQMYSSLHQIVYMLFFFLMFSDGLDMDMKRKISIPVSNRNLVVQPVVSCSTEQFWISTGLYLFKKNLCKFRLTSVIDIISKLE
jgi:hypothetical protein